TGGQGCGFQMIITPFCAFYGMSPNNPCIRKKRKYAYMKFVLQNVEVFLKAELKAAVNSRFHLEPRHRKKFSVAYCLNQVNVLAEIRMQGIKLSFNADF